MSRSAFHGGPQTLPLTSTDHLPYFQGKANPRRCPKSRRVSVSHGRQITFFPPIYFSHIARTKRRKRNPKDTFPAPAIHHTPGFRDGTSASSATSLNRAGIESGGGLGGCRLGLLVPHERPPARQPISEPLKASNTPGGFSGDIHPSRKAPADSWDEAVLKTPRQPSASAPRPALDPAKSAWVPEIGTGRAASGPVRTRPRRAISRDSSPVLRATASHRSRSDMGAIPWKVGIWERTPMGSTGRQLSEPGEGGRPAARGAARKTKRPPAGRVWAVKNNPILTPKQFFVRFSGGLRLGE